MIESEYLRPNYSEEPLYDSGDDYDDDDDEDEDYNDYDEGEEETKMENYFTEQEKLNERIMTQSPFSQWGNNNQQNNNQQVPWNQPSTQWQPTYPSWNQPRPTWGNSGSSWTPNNNNSWGFNSNQQSNKKEIDRQKKIIFCDVLDCLIETWQSNGKPGLLPRGIYDVRLKFEVWDKIACFNPEKVYGIIPRNLILSSNGSDSWRVLLDYVICSLSEYLRVPYNCCTILAQREFSLSKDVIMKTIIENQLNKKDIIQIGLDSGLTGQSNRDLISSKSIGIDYIDLGQLMTMYY